jgi:hypothetical protein
MELKHSRDEGEQSTPLGTIGRDDTSACLRGDWIRIDARLSAPAYCYLIALHPTGDIELYYPEGESEEAAEATPPPLSHDLSYPSDPLGKNLKSPLTDGVGFQAFVLVVSRKPLPPYSEWKKARLGNLPWAGHRRLGVPRPTQGRSQVIADQPCAGPETGWSVSAFLPVTS